MCPGKALWNSPSLPSFTCTQLWHRRAAGYPAMTNKVNWMSGLQIRYSAEKGWMTHLFFHEAWWLFPPSNLSPSYTRESDEDTKKLVTICLSVKSFTWTRPFSPCQEDTTSRKSHLLKYIFSVRHELVRVCTCKIMHSVSVYLNEYSCASLWVTHTRAV